MNIKTFLISLLSLKHAVLVVEERKISRPWGAIYLVLYFMYSGSFFLDWFSSPASERYGAIPEGLGEVLFIVLFFISALMLFKPLPFSRFLEFYFVSFFSCQVLTWLLFISYLLVSTLVLTYLKESMIADLDWISVWIEYSVFTISPFIFLWFASRFVWKMDGLV